VPRTLKLTLAYDGSAFNGWQIQPGLPTIQGMLAEAIGRITAEKVLPQGSGRTDAGVHALGQIASFTTESTIPNENFIKAFNSNLPPEIRILNVEDAAADFHARHSAKAKTYRYRMYRGSICPPFIWRHVYHHPYPLNESFMTEAAKAVVGEHDFTSFAAVDPDRAQSENGDFPNNVRSIFVSGFRRDGEELVYEVRGNGFLHHMVRNLVGTFLLVGKETLRPDQVREIIAARNRSANPGATAPASGLYLVSVEY
jgi:tRNA pseudouridine38-40 synthase